MLRQFPTALLCVTACVALSLPAVSAPVGSGKSAPDQVSAATEAWAAAYNSRDPAQILGTYDNDAMLWGATEKAIAIGPAQIKDGLSDVGKHPGARVEIGDQHVRVYGDTAVNSGTLMFSESKDGQHVIHPGRFTMVLRHHDSQWFIVALQTSYAPS
jgi:ketosteroid isomerase-like protein